MGSTHKSLQNIENIYVFEAFSVSWHETPLCSRKKCISSACLVFISIGGIRIVIFANPRCQCHAICLAMETRDSQSQIDLPTDLGRYKTYPYSLRFD